MREYLNHLTEEIILRLRENPDIIEDETETSNTYRSLYTLKAIADHFDRSDKNGHILLLGDDIRFGNILINKLIFQITAVLD